MIRDAHEAGSTEGAVTLGKPPSHPKLPEGLVRSTGAPVP
jgi:hypothetical protein